MRDFDVVVIGGGINGLTTAAYLAKSGLRVGVFERRGQCGAHCDTVELGTPGFLHNLHATWLVPALSPAMQDLELERFGLDLVGCDVSYAKPFLDEKNCLIGEDSNTTVQSYAAFSKRDAEQVERTMMFVGERLDEFLDLQQSISFEPPSGENLGRMYRFLEEWVRVLGLPVSVDDLWGMSGFEVLDVLFESDHIRTLQASLAWIGAAPPLHRRLGPGVLMLASFGGHALPVHQARGGSHSLTHALVRCLVAHGGEVWTTCPVDKILVRDGKAVGVRLAAEGMLGPQEVGAKVVVSNLSLVPTFLRMLGEEAIGSEWAMRVKAYNYDEQVLCGVYYALSDDPVFASAAHDPGIQRTMMGYFGGETSDDLRRFQIDLVSGVLHERVAGNWFVPTRADPSQAPPGCHTSFVWVDVPPAPRRWRGASLRGWESWPEIAEAFGDAVTDAYESFAPGFRDLIVERYVMTPVDQERNNPSAVRGNMIGGSCTPDQYYMNRPLPGIIVKGASRTFVPGLYMSNSIHPLGASLLASGYLAAREVADDLGAFDPAWWNARAFRWYLENGFRIPKNEGVNPKWLPNGQTA